MLVTKFRNFWLCRDDLYSQNGVIKSAALSLDGKVAPFALHLYLEEMAIFQEVPSLLPHPTPDTVIINVLLYDIVKGGLLLF